MTIRIMVLLKRKQGMSPEEFREKYERGHVRLAVKLFGHLWTAYRRHYLGSANSFVQVKGAPTDGAESDSPSAPYDVITELVFDDAADLDEMNRVVAQNQALLSEDEKRMFDRPSCLLVRCSTIEEDLSHARSGRPKASAELTADQRQQR